MKDYPNTTVLINCTIEAIVKFPWTTSTNSCEVVTYNRSDTLNLLSEMITKHNELYVDVDANSGVTNVKWVYFLIEKFIIFIKV